MLRRQSARTVGLYVTRHTDQSNITVEELEHMFMNNDQESHNLAGRVARLANTVPGTRPFWAKHRNELEAMVKTVGCANLFVTFSAADLHWDDLMRHLPRYEEWRTGNQAVRDRIATVNIRDHPHIVAQWFVLRFEAFRETVTNYTLLSIDF